MNKTSLKIYQEQAGDKLVWVAKLEEWGICVQSEDKYSLRKKMVDLAVDNVNLAFDLKYNYGK